MHRYLAPFCPVPAQAGAAALRTFWRLAEAWKLKPAEQMTLLGVGRSALYQWKAGKVGPLDRHVLERLSYLFGIYAALQLLLPEGQRADAWVRRPTVRRCSTVSRRCSACSAGRWPTCMWCVSILTRNAAARLIEADEVPVRAVAWKPCYRLIASRYPTVGLYDAIADPADLEAVFAIEALTNPRLRNELGELQLVPADERISGTGSTPIMAAFTHLNRRARASDGSYGVYYAANDLDTAVAEVSHHRAVFMARTQEPAIDIDLRLILAPLDAKLHDLRGLRRSAPRLYDPVDYSAGRALGRQLREAGSWGVLYQSVRRDGGLRAGVFRPRA